MTRLRARLVAAALALLVATAANADESDPLPVPLGTRREAAVRVYNEGVQRLLARDHAGAQRHFEQALALDDLLAEAHNNLAYSLRMQGGQNFARALRHYDRAIELKPALAQAYMYRGALFTQIGDLERARADHRQLVALDPALAARLASIIAGAPARGEGNAGIAAQYE